VTWTVMTNEKEACVVLTNDKDASFVLANKKQCDLSYTIKLKGVLSYPMRTRRVAWEKNLGGKWNSKFKNGIQMRLQWSFIKVMKYKKKKN